MKHLIIMLTLIFAATLFHPVPAEATRSDSETVSQMFLEVQNSEVLILNEKPLHVDFLSAVLMEHQNTDGLEITLTISSDAPMGLVRDTKQLLNELGIEASLSITP